MNVMTRTEGTRRYPTPALEKGLDAPNPFASESNGLTKMMFSQVGRTVSKSSDAGA
jgi:hypothetical protein